MQYGLLCGHGFFKELGYTLFTVGAVLCVPWLSAAADRFGRKPVLLCCLSVSVFGNLAVFWARDLWLFWALRFLVGAASDGYLTIAGIMCCELVAQDLRNFAGLVYNVAWSGGLLYTGLLSVAVPDWRLFYLLANLPLLFAFPVFAL